MAVDHLVNNAGIAPVSFYEEANDVTNFASAMDANFWGSLYTTPFCSSTPEEEHRQDRRNYFISRIALSPRLSFYNAIKAAAISLYETLRVEFGSDIGVTIVTPGLIESEITKGKFLNKEERLEVDQVMRYVEVSIEPVAKAERCAKPIVNSACRGENYLTVPPWARMAVFWEVFCPELLDWCSRWLFITGRGTSPEEEASKKILDLSELKKYLYPDSIQTPEIKVD